MPEGNPLGYLLEPTIPKKVIQPVQNWLEEPALDRSPMEAGIRGFASGALEGLRGLMGPSPAELALAPLSFLGQGAGAAAKMARPVRQAFDVVDDIPVRQGMPSAQEAWDLTQQLGENLRNIPSAGQKAIEGLKSAARPALDAGEQAYETVRRNVLGRAMGADPFSR